MIHQPSFQMYSQLILATKYRNFSCLDFYSLLFDEAMDDRENGVWINNIRYADDSFSKRITEYKHSGRWLDDDWDDEKIRCRIALGSIRNVDVP